MDTPDKQMDYISNYLQDKFMEGDKESKIAIECAIFGRNIFVGGEVTSKTEVDVIESVKEVLEKTGYGYIKDTFNIENHIIKQSPEIYEGVVKDDGNIGAGDQGLMWGYASDTDRTNYMPIGAFLSHQLAKRLTDVREQGILPYLRPDGKTQVTVKYDENDRFLGIDTVVVSSMHTEDVSLEKVRSDIKKEVIDCVLEKEGIDSLEVKKLVNTAGTFILGFGDADAGLTGRKIIVDSYGGYAKHGGGAYCVDGDTEYMSSPGKWIKISEYKGGKVAQWNEGELEFVEPIKYINTKSDNMYQFKSPTNIDMVLSENHDVVYETSKKNLAKKKVRELLEQHYNSDTGFKGRIPVYFKPKVKSKLLMTDDEIRLHVAICADSSIKDNRIVRFNLKKKYKKDRLIKLLGNLGIEYKLTDDKNGYTRIWFDYEQPSKSLYNVLNGCDVKQMKVIADEVFKWDGSKKHKIFRTTNKEDADFIQYIFMSVYGKSSSIVVDDRRGEFKTTLGKDYEVKSVIYGVYLKDNKYVGFKKRANKKDIEITKFNTDRMYCFTVPSGMLVLRRNNKVFVTGNCGKDFTKVDRSGAYFARYLAKNVLHDIRKNYPELDVKDVEVQLGFAIGVVQPVSLLVNVYSHDKNKKLDIGDKYEQYIKENIDCSPKGIIDTLKLKDVKVEGLSAYGHFGRDGYSWEELNIDFNLK